jgi:hypothetical protein
METLRHLESMPDGQALTNSAHVRSRLGCDYLRVVMLAEQDPSILGTRRLIGIAAATTASILFLAIAPVLGVVLFAVVRLWFSLVAVIGTVLGVAVVDSHV